MSKLKEAVLDRAVANAMGLKSVHNCEKWGERMTEEDEEFQRIEREAEMRRMAEEDDDIQVYKKPWVDLSDSQLEAIYYEVVAEHRGAPMPWGQVVFAKAVQAALKEKNA